jgi:uncharacterized repeat protein (TIGR01451 family)
MASKVRTLGPTTLLALAAFAAALLFSSPAQTAPGDVADLAVTKTGSPDPVNVGATLTYTIQVSNLGPQGATNVTVTDRLPSRTDFVSAATTSGTCDRKGREVTCSIGSLAADPSKANAVTVAIQVRPTKKGTIANKVSVDSVETDPVGVNDSAEASTTVVEPLVASCRGVTATLTGTPGSDRLVGTATVDVIVALGGDDAIVSLAGADLVCAGGGNDRVVTGTAGDRVYGDGGRDRLLGRGGPDLLAGGGRNDVLKGGRGNDRLRGGRGFDRCYGGAGLDTERGCEV